MSIHINSIEYSIISKLGKGGYGQVYHVINKLNEKHYAIKEFSIKEGSNEEIYNLQKEAKILSEFNSNNIVKYYDSSNEKDKFYILMEYCDGQNLTSFIKGYKDKNALIEENILDNIIKQISLGIKDIHDKNIIHRDLKPDNIFMNKNMEIKIGNFGISKKLNSYKQYSLTIKKAGTLDYIAPEIIYDGICCAKSDMWSLGCIIYELFTFNNYNKDKFFNIIKKIDNDIYNPKWQELMESLLQNDFNKRPNINQIYQKYFCEELNSQNKKDNLNEINISNKNIKINQKNEIVELNNNKEKTNLNTNIESNNLDMDENIFNLDKSIKIPKILGKLEWNEAQNENLERIKSKK